MLSDPVSYLLSVGPEVGKNGTILQGGNTKNDVLCLYWQSTNWAPEFNRVSIGQTISWRSSVHDLYVINL